MSIPQFEVVLKGVSAGFDVQQAQSDFAALFSLSAEKVARLFAARRTVLKSGIDQETAQKYVARLARIGVDASAGEISAAAPVEAAEPIEASTPAEQPSIEAVQVESAVAPEIPHESFAATNVASESDVTADGNADLPASGTAFTLEAIPETAQENSANNSEAFVSDAYHQASAAEENPADVAEPVLDFEPVAGHENDSFSQADTGAGNNAERPATTFGATASTKYPMVFTGKGFEYFKIWIVNLLLNILTIGIYSAWAKVRNKQYFYGNTQIADTSFEYTAEPLKILKGRAIAFVLYLGLILSGKVSPIASLVFSLAFLAFLPWIIVSSLRFNARHTSYRNIPFRFHGTVWGAVGAFLGWMLLGMFSFGLLLPFTWKKQMQYITNNHSYGTEPFHFDVHVKEYYKMLLIMFAAAIGFGVLFMLLLGGGGLMAVLGQGNGQVDPKMFLGFIPAIAAYIVFYFGLGAYVVVSMANIHMNNTRLKSNQFVSDWKLFSYLGLLLTNTIGILLTLGLFIPFAKVRTAAYRAKHTAIIVNGDLDGFIAHELDQASSVGEGVHDLFDIDISL